MNRETGRPKFDGRYVVYVEGVMGWLEPHIVMWTKNGWHFLHSTQDYPDDVKFWYGPLPVMSAAAWAQAIDNPEPEPLEFDL